MSEGEELLQIGKSKTFKIVTERYITKLTPENSDLISGLLVDFRCLCGKTESEEVETFRKFGEYAEWLFK